MNPELMAAVFGIAIILAAIIINAMQRRSAAKANSYAALPHLEINRERTDGCAVKIILHNSGVGDACVEQVEIFVDGLIIPADIKSTVENALSHLGLSGYDIICYIPSNGELIHADQSSILIEANPVNAEEQKKISSLLNRLTFKIKYKSVYDEEFVVSEV
ncbi:MAG: hypothetical protein AB1775_07575 [Bacteroidota bacterium]